MSNKMFEKMCGLDRGLSDAPQQAIEQDVVSQEELDQQLKIVPSVPALGILGAKIGWRDSGSEKGRGVYAMEDIPQGTCIEVAPVIVVAKADVPDSGGAPDGYLLDWEPEEEGQEHCMPLGYIMLYNHSRDANIYLENDHEEMTISSFAARDIRAGEELTWDYACEIWFDED
ncbi:MAG: SET domain-containing protein-lysine N-methyltransferase [Alphaproteobacteria bacterium]|nr:SET domain-containing protein-lysine N-methyltransferase [Alphaproteobacteria bacterium]